VRTTGDVYALVEHPAIAGDLQHLAPHSRADTRVVAALRRLQADSSAGLVIAPADIRITADVDGVVLAGGNVIIASGVTVRGLIVAAGAVTVEADARLIGAAHAGGDARIGGHLQADPCLVERHSRRLGLHAPRLNPTRGWLPAF
jgi:hypothetical protein